MRPLPLALAAFSLLLPALGSARAAAELRVFPSEVDLQGSEDRQSIVVQVVDQDGITRDVTTTATMRAADPSVVSIQQNIVAPVKDGRTMLRIESGSLKAEIPVTVKEAAVSRPVSFRLDVMPIFMKHGCNNGSCHGAARGKDGFMLSLFGYDPAGDYYRLTREFVGRRIDIAVPEKSLMLEKVTAAVSHSGGKLFDTNHDDYKTLYRWLKRGALDDGNDTPYPVSVELLPKKVVFAGKGQSQITSVQAKYSDGSTRDVTRLALYLSNNESIATIDWNGQVKAGGRGAAFVFARFGKFTVGSEVIVLPTNDQFTWPKPPEKNYIDTLVFDKLKKLHVAPSELCSDEAFLRRVYLDLIGLPPTRTEFDQFLADTDVNKRTKLIDTLMDRPEFVDIWTMKWGELLRIRANNQQPSYGRDAKAMYSYAVWVKEQMAKNRPLDEFAAELLAGTGSNIQNPTSNLYTAGERLTPEKTAEDIAQVFLGTRIQCTQCHNHPFDRWTMDDYYGFAAFFAGVTLRRGVEGREVVVTNNNARNTVAHPVDNRRMKPKFLGGEMPEVEGQDPRRALAKWMTSSDNVAFRQTMANIIWAHFFGRGIVDPVDDVRISNPPSNKELLEAIGSKLAEYEFDKKKLIRDICNSRTYQLAASTNDTNELDETNFSHSYTRRLRAEVLLDAITHITGTEDRFALSPPGTRAVEIHTGEVTNYFLTTFGRAPRETPCSCEVSKAANLSQALHLVNGDTITNKITRGPLLPALIKEKKTPEAIIEELYVLTFSRKPTEQESKQLADIVARETRDTKRIREIAVMEAKKDSRYKRYTDLLRDAKKDLAQAKKDSPEEKKNQRLVETHERTLAAFLKPYEERATRAIYEDILWGLINSTEFTFNH